MAGPGKRESGTRWFYSQLPLDVATGVVSTLVVLYIHALHGTVIDVGLAVTLFNAVTIPAAILWGFVTDRFQSRRTILVLGATAIAADLLLLPEAGNVSGVALVYGLFSLVSSASATPANLLIMETSRKSNWASAFAKFSMISSVGTTMSFVLGAAWSYVLPESLLVVPLALLSLVSAALSMAMIREPEVSFEREVMVHQRRSLQQRLLAIPLIFLRIPDLVDFKSVFRGLRSNLTRNLPLLYISIFVFYIASGLFNTSFVPSLLAKGLTASEVFVVVLVANVAQMASFNFAGPYVERRDLRKAAVAGLTLRMTAYAGIGVVAEFGNAASYLGGTLVLYPLAGGLAYALYYTSSNTMVFNTLGARNQGSRLGVYSALVGVATMTGSLLSGYVSFYLGYLATFALAAATLGACALLVPAISSTLHEGPPHA